MSLTVRSLFMSIRSLSLLPVTNILSRQPPPLFRSTTTTTTTMRIYRSLATTSSSTTNPVTPSTGETGLGGTRGEVSEGMGLPTEDTVFRQTPGYETFPSVGPTYPPHAPKNSPSSVSSKSYGRSTSTTFATDISKGTNDYELISTVNDRAASTYIGPATESIPVNGTGVHLARNFEQNLSLEILPPEARTMHTRRNPTDNRTMDEEIKEYVGIRAKTAYPAPNLSTIETINERAGSSNIGDTVSENIPIATTGNVLTNLYPPSDDYQKLPRAPWSPRSGSSGGS